MSEQELDLLKLSACLVAQSGTGTAEIVRRNAIQTTLRGRRPHDAPYDFRTETACRDPAGLVDRPKNRASRNASSGQPVVDRKLDPGRDWHRGLSELFKRLIDGRPKIVLPSGSGFKLEVKIREGFDKKYGQHETTIAVSQLLKDLTGKISDEAERLFLSESIKCYNVKAFRAAIVMAWNLAYDHLLHWVLADPQRLADFNSKIVARVDAKRGSGG
jgi:hypothetical protein